MCPKFATNVKRLLLEHHALDLNIFILTPMSRSIYIPSNQEPGVFIYGVRNKIGGFQSYKNKYRNTRTQCYDFSTLYNDHYNYREDWETELWYFVNAEKYTESSPSVSKGFERLTYSRFNIIWPVLKPVFGALRRAKLTKPSAKDVGFLKFLSTF